VEAKVSHWLDGVVVEPVTSAASQYALRLKLDCINVYPSLLPWLERRSHGVVLLL
jgi:hypothetical protein